MAPPNRVVPAFLAGLIFASSVHTADGVGTLQLRAGHWQVREQIWLDGKEVLSALDEAARKINEGIRANLSPADREAFDREVSQRGSLNLQNECISPAESRMNARAALEQMTRSLHAPPWSCSFRDERASSSGFEYRYSCRTGAGGRAEGQARFMLRGNSEYEGTIEGTSHAIDNATGEPLQLRIIPVRSLTKGSWIAAQCPANSEDAYMDDAVSDAAQEEPAEE
jgi:Protein of unknown function (DUF3617)